MFNPFKFDEGAVGGMQGLSQEDGDNRTAEDYQNMIYCLEQEVKVRDLKIGMLDQEVIILKAQLDTLRENVNALSVDRPSPIIPSTVTTTTTWTGPILTQPQVTFSSSLLRPIVSQMSGISLHSTLNDGITVPQSTTSTIPPGFKLLSEKRESKSNTPDLIQLDDSSESDKESSSSSASLEVDPTNQDDLRSVVRMLGRHSCPKPEIYSLASGRSFSRFLLSFEAYCDGKYSSAHKDLWTSELGRFLEGEMKQVYDACGGPETKYKRMKAHLEKWHVEAKERITSSR